MGDFHSKIFSQNIEILVEHNWTGRRTNSLNFLSDLPAHCLRRRSVRFGGGTQQSTKSDCNSNPRRASSEFSQPLNHPLQRGAPRTQGFPISEATFYDRKKVLLSKHNIKLSSEFLPQMSCRKSARLTGFSDSIYKHYRVTINILITNTGRALV